MLSKKSISCVSIAVFLGWLLASGDYSRKWSPKNYELVEILVSRIRDVFWGVLAHKKPAGGQTTKNDEHGQSLKVFTKSELSKYKGETTENNKKGPVYLAVFGRVYDVSKGRKHYGPGEAYSIFAGIDGSRAFVTGDFTEAGLTDDIESLESSQLFDLINWMSFYDEQYKLIGYLSGRFYDSNGQPTEVLMKIENRIKKYHEEQKKLAVARNSLPPCNDEWSPTGSRVWCSQKSGGVSRDWAGVPRQHFKPGSTSPTCVCVRDPENNGHHKLKEYKGCDSLATSCNIISE